jgi:hypothetical protein
VRNSLITGKSLYIFFLPFHGGIMNWKGFGRNPSWPDITPEFSWRKTMKNLNQHKLFPDRDSNGTPPLYKSIEVFFLACEAIGTAATPGLLCQPRVMVKMIVEKQMGCRLAGETQVFGENLPQRHLCPSQNHT